HRVVWSREDGLREILADLRLVDVEGGDELDVPDVIAAQVDVHEAWHGLRLRGVAVVVHALDQRGRAVADPHDGDTHLSVGMAILVAVLLTVLHALTSSRTFTRSLIPSIWSRRARSRAMFSTSSEQ